MNGDVRVGDWLVQPRLARASKAGQTVHLRTGQWKYAGLCPLDLNFSIGQSVHAKLDPENLYFFDTNSGLRI